MAEDIATILTKHEDKAIRTLENDFLKSVRITVKETDWEKLEKNLLTRKAEGDLVEDLVWGEFDPTDPLKDLFDVTLESHGTYIGKVTGGGAYNWVDPNGVEWVEKFGASEVKYITKSQKDAIKDIILKGYQEGISPAKQARMIRAHIGLDPARSEALRKYGEHMFSQGKSEANVWRLMEVKGRTLLNARARVIATNEATETGSQATYLSTKSAVERGVIDPGRYEEYRIVTPDDHLCARCGGVEGEARPLPSDIYPSTGRTTAKVHTVCRCVAGLREKSKKETREAVKCASDVVIEAKGLRRKDGIIYCPTVPMKEGVYSGRGFPVLREYSEFSKDSRWLQGLTVLTNHEPLTPDARRIGQLADVVNVDADRKVAAITQFYESDLTPNETEKILSREPLHGSLNFSCILEDGAGEWTDPETGEVEPYMARERGPYVYYEYSLVRYGVVTPDDGAGFNMECASCKAKALENGGIQMVDKEGAKPVAIEPTVESRFASIETKITSLAEENKALKATLEAKAETEHRALFEGKLKPAFLEKAPELWRECKETGFLKFESAHPEMIISAKETGGVRGNPLDVAKPEFSLAKEQAKIDYTRKR